MIIGIDPGLCGAIAFFDAGALLRVVDMPTVEVGTKSKIAVQALALLLAAQSIAHAYVEQLHPGQHPNSAFGMGYGQGVLDGLLATTPITYCAPSAWKRGMQVTADKGSSRRRAMQLFPAHAADFGRVKDDGRAEACLIGAWGMRA